MIYILLGVIAVAALYGLSQLASSDRYAKMTEKEFEEEARRTSSLGAAMVGVQKIFDPSHNVEYVQEQKHRAEAESEDSGDRPPEDLKPKEKS